MGCVFYVRMVGLVCIKTWILHLLREPCLLVSKTNDGSRPIAVLLVLSTLRARAAFGAARSDDVETAPGEVIIHGHDATLRIERVVRVVVVVGHRRVIVVVELHLVERVKTLHHLFAPFSTHQTKIDERAIEIGVVDEIPREGHRGVEVGHRVRGAARDE